MGTNYYHRKNICECCKRFDEVHIGKSSGGWTFSFHATDEIRSWKDWQKELAAPNTKIFDEYGYEISLQEFIDLVNAKASASWNHARDVWDINSDYNQTMRIQYGEIPWPAGLENKTDFLDAEGHSFSTSDFS